MLSKANRSTYHWNGHEIIFDDYVEIGQGGPRVGKVIIDGKDLFDHFFSEPPIFHGELIFVPVMVRSWLSIGFKVGVINIRLLSLRILGKKESIILLDRIENGLIYFRTSMYGSKESLLRFNCD